MYDRQMPQTGRLIGAAGPMEARTATEAAAQFQQIKERPELAVALSDLDNSLSCIESLNRELAGRLNPVMRPEPTNDCAQGTLPNPVRSPVSDEIERFDARLRAECAFISGLLARLAV